MRKQEKSEGSEQMRARLRPRDSAPSHGAGASLRTLLRRLGYACHAFGSALTQPDAERLERFAGIRDQEEPDDIEGLLANAVTLIDACAWAWDPAVDDVFVSERARHLLGIPDGKSVKSRVELLAACDLHPDDRQGFAHMLQTAPTQQDGVEIDYRVLAEGGGVRWIRSRNQTISRTDHHPSLLIGSLTDITDRKHAEAALRASEERYRAVVESQTELVCRSLPDTTITFVNEAYCRFFGLTREELIGRRYLELIPPEAQAGVLELVNSLVTEPRAHQWEHEATLADGTRVWQQWIDLAIVGVDGKVMELQGIGRDITKLKQTEDELRSRQDMLDLAQKAARATAFRCGGTHGENRLSDDLAAMHGLAPGGKDARFGDLRRLVHPDDRPIVRAALAAGRKSGEIAAEYRIIRADGAVRWLQARGRMLFDATGAATGIIGFLLDVSQRHESEEELKRLEAQLRRAQRLEAVGTLAGGIAHDFNNILGAILGYGEMAQRQAPLGSRLRRELDTIVTAGERGRALVDQILAFSRSTGKEHTAVQLEEVTREALNLVAAKRGPKVRLASTLKAGQAAVTADPTQIHQVVMNLLTNALQAMPEGGTLRVDLDVTTLLEKRLTTTGSVGPGDYVALEVADTGVGIPSAVIDKIFDPFFTTKDVGFGTGLGLSLVHRIVAELGGAIDVASVVNQGSVFTVYLPRMGDVVATERPGPVEVAQGSAQRVLVVDDEEPLMLLAADWLREIGYHALGFTSSLAALEAFRADPSSFDAVVTDERMPGMTGSALIRELRSLRPAIPVMLVCGYVAGALSAKAAESGADEVLRKPLSSVDLAAALARILKQPNRRPGDR